MFMFLTFVVSIEIRSLPFNDSFTQMLRKKCPVKISDFKGVKLTFHCYCPQIQYEPFGLNTWTLKDWPDIVIIYIYP